MTAGVNRLAGHSVLGGRLYALLRQRVRLGEATPEQVSQLRALFELPEHWHEQGSPCDGFAAECWPARKVNRAPDAANHKLPVKGQDPPGDGPRERHRQYCYRFVSVLRKLGSTPVDLKTESGMNFDPPTLADTLRGFTFGRAAQRRRYLQALVLVVLNRGYSVSQVIDWLAGWGAPVDSSDPVLYLGAGSVPHDSLPTNASMVEALEALWPRNDTDGRILAKADRLKEKKGRRGAQPA